MESLRLGNNFIGIDTNPVAILIAESKLFHPEPKKFKAIIGQVIDEAHIKLSTNDIPAHHQEEELKKWYHPDTVTELNILLQEILKIENKDYRRCTLSVFSSILKSTSSQGKHWGWVCDNVRPKPDEIVYKNAITTFFTAGKDFIDAAEASFTTIKYFNSDINRSTVRKNATLRQGDCVIQMKKLAGESVDLIMTSPPYYGVADYIKSQRLTYLWFDTDELSSHKLGFRHFEQLRAQEKGSRSHRHRSNSRQQYMNFISNMFTESYRVLKPNAYMSLIVGESSAREATTEALISAANQAGFQLELRKDRNIRANKRRLMAKVKGEDVLIFKKALA